MTNQIHACFISYRHPAAADSLEEKVIRHVVKAISDRVQMYTHDHEIYFDKPRLVPGYEYDERLSEAICRSACMVVVYWPSYLESDYCHKEIRAMLAIEERRKKQLGPLLHGCRLFIPVLLRGKFEDLPKELSEGCQYMDYRRQALLPNVNIGDEPAMSERWFRVAEYIKTLCDKLKTEQAGLFEDCKEFVFPSGAATDEEGIKAPPQQPFPGRS